MDGICGSWFCIVRDGDSGMSYGRADLSQGSRTRNVSSFPRHIRRERGERYDRHGTTAIEQLQDHASEERGDSRAVRERSGKS